MTKGDRRLVLFSHGVRRTQSRRRLSRRGRGGSRTRELLALGESDIVEVAVNALADALRLSRRDVRRHLERWFFHDWTADPSSRGAYGYPTVGASASPALARPLTTLFFAGEASAPPPDNGTMEGARASGERAAREVLRSLTRSRPVRPAK